MIPSILPMDEVPVNQPIKIVLARAAKELKLTNTADLLAKVRNTELNVEQSCEYHTAMLENDGTPR